MLNNVKCRMVVKLLLSLSFLLILFTPKSFGQTADKDIQVKWGVLKTALKARAGLMVDMTNDLLKQGKDYKKLVFGTNLISKNIMADTSKKLDSKTIKDFFLKNDSLENQGFEILMSPKIEKDAATSKKIDVFVKKMDAADKMIKAAIRNFNAACITAKKEDLQYVNPNPDADL